MPQVARLKRERLQRSFAGKALRDHTIHVVGMNFRAPVEQPSIFGIKTGPAGELRIGVIDEIAPAIEPRNPHQGRRGIGDAAESLFAFAKRPFGRALLGDVGDYDHNTVDPSRCRVDPWNVICLRRGHAALRVVEGCCEKLALAGQRGFHHRFALGEILRAEHFLHRPADHVPARASEPFRERLIDEAVPGFTVDERGHHREQVGEGEQARPSEHRGGQIDGDRQVGGLYGFPRLHLPRSAPFCHLPIIP